MLVRSWSGLVRCYNPVESRIAAIVGQSLRFAEVLSNFELRQLCWGDLSLRLKNGFGFVRDDACP